MSGFSNSLSHFYGTHAIQSDNPIHTFSNFTQVSQFVSSLDLSVSEYQTYNICNFCNNSWWTICRKSLPNLSTHLPLRRYPTHPICNERR